MGRFAGVGYRFTIDVRMEGQWHPHMSSLQSWSTDITEAKIVKESETKPIEAA